MNKKNIFNIIFSSSRVLLFLGLAIWLNVATKNNIDAKANLASVVFSTVIVLLVITVANALSVALNFYPNVKNQKSYIVISILAFNIENLFFMNRKLNLKFYFKRWKTLNIVVVGLLLALFCATNLITDLIPKLPFFISLSFKFIPLFFGAYILSFSQAFVLCALAGAFTFVFPGTYKLSAEQWLFDYFFPVLSPCVASLLKPVKSEKKLFETIDWLIFITIPIMILYFSRVIAGVLFWFENAWIGFGPWGYSLVFNSFNAVFDYLLLIILVPSICKTLEFIKYKMASEDGDLLIEETPSMVENIEQSNLKEQKEN